ncbi:hypothetical protein ABZW30_09585 [Kitasatospora sp. NPDC004669]|uniref:hypothetical protein n=1 Tax=Kitasatospora sp. NPDC004669 TaxID=3154555 RepID=UPI00339E2838
MISAATNVSPQDAEVQAQLRDLRNRNAAVVQGMSRQARDGATAADPARTAELALRAWP